MDPISLLMAGTSLAGGLSSFFGGKSASKKAQEAAALQYQREKEARAAAEAAGQAYKGDLTGYAQSYNPFVETGYESNDAYNRLLQDPSSVRSLPGYDFARSEGINALDASASSRGMLKSGRAAKDIMRFGTGLADSTYGSQVDRLLQGSKFGMGALDNKNTMLERGSRGAMDSLLYGAGLGFKSAGTEPAGMVAGKQAELKGIEGLFGGLGSALGGFRGSSFAGSSPMTKLPGLY